MNWSSFRSFKGLVLVLFVLGLGVLASCIFPTSHTVTYNGNGSDGGTVPVDSSSYAEGATVTVASVGTLVKTGNTFIGWNTAADGSGTARLAGSTFIMGTTNVTLYAQWTTDPTYTVTYNGNGNDGGTAPTDSNNYREGATVTVASVGTLVKTANTLSGWNTAANGSGTSHAAASTFAIGTANVTLYAQWRPVAIGDAYQGGIVAYIFLNRNPGYEPADPGYVAGEIHGLIAATADQSTGIVWALPAYQSTLVGTLQALGSGLANTDKIIAQNGAGTAYAAGLARAYRGGGYSDWYLPSLDELNKLFLNKAAIGGFTNQTYWSSFDAGNAEYGYYETFLNNGTQGTSNKQSSFYVRAVRSF
jgi:uncharacterized repeat protein (TIGR02543 family)